MITDAYGTIKLVGDWTAGDLELLNPAAESWGGPGFSLDIDLPFSLERRELRFWGSGELSFYGTLVWLHRYTLNWIQRCEGERPRQGRDYQDLLERMKAKDLKLYLDYRDGDEPEGGEEDGLEISHVTVFLASDGNELIVQFESSEAINLERGEWSRYSPEALEEAAALFSRFLSKPDHGAVREWLRQNTKYFQCFGDDYIRLMEDGHHSLHNGVLRDFSRRFLPDTDEWRRFNREARLWGYFCDVSGKSLELRGDWTEGAVSLLRPVLAFWRFDCSFGLWDWEYQPLTLEPGERKIEFVGRGRWKFSELLSRLDGVTWNRIKTRSGPADEYTALLKVMHERDLTIWLTFVDSLDSTWETGALFSDGLKLHYRQESTQWGAVWMRRP